MATKVNKKELKQPDILQSQFAQVLSMLQRHRTRIVQAAVVLGVVVLLGCGWVLYEWSNSRAAAALYLKAEDETMRAALSAPSNREKTLATYAKIIDQYPRSSSAMLARYRLAGDAYDQGRLDRAIDHYNAFIKQAPADSPLVALAWNGLGCAYEAKGNLPQARQSFERALSSKAGDGFSGMTHQNLARVFEAQNDPRQALTHYRMALERVADPALARLLKRKIALLN
jgi:predicted negative regulator of RcsB-dependent stress response